MGKLLIMFLLLTCLLSLSEIAYARPLCHSKVKERDRYGNDEEDPTQTTEVAVALGENMTSGTRNGLSFVDICTYEVEIKTIELCLATVCHMLTYETPIKKCHYS